MRGKKSIAIVASAGGHLVEAIKATSSLRGYPRFYVTFQVPHIQEYLAGEECFFVNFPRFSFRGYAQNFVQSTRVYLRKKPAVIITTGGGVAVPFCLVGWMFGSKIIFVESGSRVVYPSRASKVLYRIAHLSIVQWRSLLVFFPKAVYGGPLL